MMNLKTFCVCLSKVQKKMWNGKAHHQSCSVQDPSNPGPTIYEFSHMFALPTILPHTAPRAKKSRSQTICAHSSAAVGTSAFARGLRSEGRVGPRAVASPELSSIRWPRGGAFAFSLFSVFLRPVLGTWLGLGSRFWRGQSEFV